MTSRYDGDVLAARPPRRVIPEVEAVVGLVVETAEADFCGAVVELGKDVAGRTVTLEDRNGGRRVFLLQPAAFLLDGAVVTLVLPRVLMGTRATGPARTASGSRAVSGGRARVARGSRIWVEGVHDAELVEKVWGDDLRVEGVVVERLDGIDDLEAEVAAFEPAPDRKLGVLVDHLIEGSKESRIAQDVLRSRWAPHVRVLGHPYVDVWQAVRPAALGIAAWPSVPRGTEWKSGVCEALGWVDDTRVAWRRILGSVSTYADLEPALLGRVEELIDFVTGEHAA